MRARCDNPKHVSYKNYGGRGITYDPRWTAFVAFAVDMGPRPAGLTLERIDNELGYSKANCRWASRRDQLLNTRRSVKHDGKGVPELAAERGVSEITIRHRMARYGTPEPKRVVRTYEGKTIKAWAAELGVNYFTVLYRLNKYGSVHLPEGKP